MHPALIRAIVNEDREHITPAAMMRISSRGSVPARTCRAVARQIMGPRLAGQPAPVPEDVNMRRNGPCYCGSKRKLKLCHGK